MKTSVVRVSGNLLDGIIRQHNHRVQSGHLEEEVR